MFINNFIYTLKIHEKKLSHVRTKKYLFPKEEFKIYFAITQLRHLRASFHAIDRQL